MYWEWREEYQSKVKISKIILRTHEVVFTCPSSHSLGHSDGCVLSDPTLCEMEMEREKETPTASAVKSYNRCRPLPN